MAILLSTAYLPPISYLSAYVLSEKIIIERFETYTKQTCRNRCNIYGPNGIQILSIPVRKIYGNHTLVKDIRITYTLPWQKIHWKSIETAYNNSPFFLYYRDYFEPFYTRKCNFLIDLNTDLLEIIFNILGIKREIVFTDQYKKVPSITDLRNKLVQKKPSAIYSYPEYVQPFREKSGFIPDLSIIDLLFNLGPETIDYLTSNSRIRMHETG